MAALAGGSQNPPVVICGAGIAGISAAYSLAVKHGWRDVLLVDERPPLSLTSDKSTECYRNWWPGPGAAMVGLMNRSIDLLEELAGQSGNLFHLNRRGYLYVTADPAKIPAMQRAAEESSHLGAGPLRIYRGAPGDPVYQPAAAEGFAGQPEGADLILDRALLRRHFPYVSEQAVAALHARRAGWFSAQQLGAYLLAQARQYGVRLANARLTGVEVKGGRVRAVRLADGQRSQGERRIETEIFVNAAGPFFQPVGQMLGVELPVFTELHLKASFKDTLGAVPRHAPLLIWNDPQVLPWSEQERQFLAEDPETRWLLGQLPAGVHTRPEGAGDSQVVLLLWEYRLETMPPVWPPPPDAGIRLDPQYPELALRGMAALLPALGAYLEKLPRPVLDGGYYTRTRENRPLVGPLPVQGAYMIGALSGYGLMAACAAGELLAAHVTGAALPGYAAAFLLERYQDPQYQKMLQDWGDTGQL
jgi:glycine/D-amino acid oxidase-like deaminating enzyme